MTMPSSTSQSSFVEPFGIMVSSFGPQMQLGALLKMIGSFGSGSAGFGGVIGIIQPDGDEIADIADARAEPRLAAHQRQLVGLELAQLGEAFRRQRLAGNVGHDFRQVADPALGIDHAGLFAAWCAEANKFHCNLLITVCRARAGPRRRKSLTAISLPGATTTGSTRHCRRCAGRKSCPGRRAG